MKKLNRIHVFLIPLLAGILAAPAAAQPPGGGQGPPPAPVRVAEVERAAMAATTVVPGTVSSRHDARLSAEVNGRLTWIAEVGTRAGAGDVVARIDDTQLKLQQAEFEAGVQRETTRLQFLSREAERLESLMADNVAARSQYESVINDRDMARSELAVQRARLAQVNEDLERTGIQAPFDGVVAERLRQSGERVAPGDQVVRLTSDTMLEIVARAPLRAVPYLSDGMELRIERNDNTYGTGTIRTLVPFGDAQTHLFEMRISVPGDGDWKSGEAVRVAVPVSGSREVLSVPRDALILRREGVSVFRINGENRAERVEVETGSSTGDRIEVRGELAAGDRVVVRGGERLRPGQTVSIQ